MVELDPLFVTDVDGEDEDEDDEGVFDGCVCC